MRGRAEGVYASKATIVQLDRCAKTGSAGASLHSYYWQATERWLSTWTLWVADPVTLEVTPGNRNHTRAVCCYFYSIRHTTHIHASRHDTQHTNAISPSSSIQPTRLRSSLPPSQPTCHITRTHVHSHQHTHEQPGCPCWLRDSVHTYTTRSLRCCRRKRKAVAAALPP